MFDVADLSDIFNAAEYFIDRHIAEGRGHKTAIEHDGGSVSYQELYERVNQYGNLFKSWGIAPGDRVLLLLLDGPEFAASFFGAIKIGAIPVPLNTLLMSADYEYVLNDSGARGMVANKSLWSKIEVIPENHRLELQHVFIIEDGTLQQYSKELSAVQTRKNDPAFWLYSSGSTGFPKACVHLQRDMVVCSEYYAKGILNMTEKDRCFSVSKLFFAYGLGNALYYPLSVGATSILFSGSPKPEIVFDIIKKYQPTIFFSVPSNYAALMDYADQHPDNAGDLVSIRCFVSAGERLPEALFHRFQDHFHKEILDGIGSTEALQTFISNRPGAVRAGSSGQIVPGYDAKILGDDGRLVAPGEAGDLFVKTPARCAYYWNQPEKTKEAIQGEWLRTGDRYSQDSDGYFWYVGRKDDMMKCSGVWVSPIEIESVLLQHDAVLEAAVVGEDDKDGLTKPVAYITLRHGRKSTPALQQELEAFVLQRLPKYKRPRRIQFIAEIPKTATGKIQRFKLRRLSSGS